MLLNSISSLLWGRLVFHKRDWRLFFTMNIEARTEYVPGDPTLIRDIISQLKSQGVFDQFRKECISDVDTKVSSKVLFSLRIGNEN